MVVHFKISILFCFHILVAMELWMEQNSVSATELVQRAKVLKFHVTSDIFSRYSQTSVDSLFLNMNKNASEEVNFRVVLPDTAFISGFTLKVNFESYPAYVKKKEEARIDYQMMVKDGRTAGLIQTKATARNSLEFSVSVNIAAGAIVEMHLMYEELLTRKNGVYQQDIYIIPEQMKQLQEVSDYEISVNIHDFQNITYLRVPALQNDTDFDHAFKNGRVDHIARPSMNEVYILWRPRTFEIDGLIQNNVVGKFIVQYDTNRTSNSGDILVRDGYFVHFFAPDDIPRIRKHVIFVLDVSGSMNGRRIRQLKEAMTEILDEMTLSPDDFFNIVKFSSTIESWTPFKGTRGNKTIPIPATMQYIRDAHRYVSNLTANGLTDVHGALSEALRIVKSVKPINSTLKDQISRVSSKRKPTVSENLPSNVPSLIIFLSDGEPSQGIIHPEHIQQSIREANTYNTPIFSLSFGYYADYVLLQKLSLQNQGFVRRIYVDSDTVLQLKNFYNEICVPLLSDVTFSYASDVYNISLLTNLKFGLLFDGADLVVSGRVDDIPITNSTTALSSLEVKITGLSGSGVSVYKSPEYFVSKLVSKVKDNHMSFMERLWAYLTVSQLVQKDIAGNVTISNTMDSDEGSSEESTEKTTQYSELSPKERATALALKFGFVTPYTSMVVMGPPTGDLTPRPSCSCAPLHKYIYDSSDTRKQTTCPCPSISVQDLNGTCEHCIAEIAEVVQTFFNQNGTMDCPSDCKRHMLINIRSAEKNLPLVHGFMAESLRTSKNITTASTSIHTISVQDYPCCMKSGLGFCKSLKDCLTLPVMTDFKEFVNSSFFCPQYFQGEFYIGACCP